MSLFKLNAPDKNPPSKFLSSYTQLPIDEYICISCGHPEDAHVRGLCHALSTSEDCGCPGFRSVPKNALR